MERQNKEERRKAKKLKRAEKILTEKQIAKKLTAGLQTLANLFKMASASTYEQFGVLARAKGSDISKQPRNLILIFLSNQLTIIILLY